MIQMFNVLSYFRRADGLRRVSPISKREKEKKVRNVSRERNAVPTLSVFTGAASRGVGRSTAENYRTAVRSFVRFNSGRDVPLSALDAETLRTIYNKAAAKRLVKDSASFKGVLTGNERTVKRSIEAEEVHRLLLSPFPPPCGGETGREALLASGASALDLFPTPIRPMLQLQSLNPYDVH